MKFTRTTLLTSLACALLLSAPALAETHTIRKGETLFEIARDHNVSVRDLVDANSIQNPDLIFPGQTLTIPGAPARPAETRPAPSAPAPRSAPAPQSAPTPTSSARPLTASRTKTYTLGGEQLGASLSRRTTSRVDATSAEFATDTSAKVMVLKRSLRVFRLQRSVEGSRLTTSPRVDRSFALEVLGQNRITLGKKFTKSFYVTAARFPVPVGPVVLDLKTQVGGTLDVGASFPLAWSSKTGYGMTLYGSAGLGGKVSLERSIVIANAGVEAKIDLINLTLPAQTQLKLRGVDFDVNLVLGSRVSVSAFAQVGLGPFKKRFTVAIPFLNFSFGRRTIPILHGELRFGARQ